MTFNILFFTISIKKRKISLEEAIKHEKVEKLYDQHKVKRNSIHRFM